MALARQRLLLGKLAVFGIFSCLLFGTNAWDATNFRVEEMLFFIGAALLAVGVAGRAWCLAYLAGNKNQTLVTDGPYSLCRHPLYLFGLIAALGLALCTETLLIPAVVLAMFATVYPPAIRREEHQLRQQFPLDYPAYASRVSCFLPRLRTFREAESVLISPRAFRRGVQILGLFVCSAGMFELLEMLHRAGYLPTYYRIY